MKKKTEAHDGREYAHTGMGLVEVNKVLVDIEDELKEMRYHFLLRSRAAERDTKIAYYYGKYEGYADAISIVQKRGLV